MKPGPMAIGVVLACTCAATPAPVPAPARSAPSVVPAAKPDCGAGHLPRIDEKSLGQEGLGAFLASASKGTVAVDWDGTRARLVDGCRLDGAYAGAKGTGEWRFRATNRVVFRTDEISGACRGATHLVAAYITRASPPVRMNGILVPLPCPPASDSAPAPGCLARGLTGPARQSKARQITDKTPPLDMRNADVATAMAVFALIPDEEGGITTIANVGGDCPLIKQGQWLPSQYKIRSSSSDPDRPAVVRLLDVRARPSPPKIEWHGCSMDYCDCGETPVFLQCFPGQFEPVFGGIGTWEPADPKDQP